MVEPVVDYPAGKITWENTYFFSSLPFHFTFQQVIRFATPGYDWTFQIDDFLGGIALFKYQHVQPGTVNNFVIGTGWGLGPQPQGPIDFLAFHPAVLGCTNPFFHVRPYF